MTLALNGTANAQLFRWNWGCRACATYRDAYQYQNNYQYQGTCKSGSCYSEASQTGYYVNRSCSVTNASPTCSTGSCKASIDDGWQEYKPIKKESGEIVREHVKAKVNEKRCGVCSLLQRVNATRARYGLNALIQDVNLERGSQNQAWFCGRNGYLIHAGGVAEILAMNGQGIETAINQWLNSPQHRALLLNGRFRYAGVAVYRDAYGRAWCAVQFR